MSARRRQCSVPGCCEKFGAMFLFPKDAHLRGKWKQVCKIRRDVSDFMLVCHRHFSPLDVSLSGGGSRKVLRKGTLPMLHLPDSVVRKPRRNCIIHGCGNFLREGVSLHFFPKNPNLQRQWAMICKLSQAPSRNTRICSQHFCDEDFSVRADGVRTLRSGAKPSRHLPTEKPICDARPKSRLWLVKATISAGRTTSCGPHPEEDSPFQCCGAEWLDPRSAQVHLFVPSTSSAVIDPGALTQVWQAMEEFAMSGGLGRFEALRTFLQRCPCLSIPRHDNNQVESCPNVLRSILPIRKMTGLSGSAVQLLSQMVTLVAPTFATPEFLIMQKVSLCLCKLYLNWDFECLGLVFGISPSESRRAFSETVHLLALILKPLIRLPPLTENSSSMPAYLKSNYRDTRLIVDVVRLPVSISDSCLKCLSSVSHHYGQKPSFFKVLLGVSPSGMISLVSQCFGESAAESSMFEESDILRSDLLDFSRDAVMVSHSLPVQSLCEQRGLKIHYPSVGFLNDISDDCLARNHVQRCFNKMCVWQIMTCLNWSCVPCCDDIVAVIAGLCNVSALDPPVMRSDCGC